MNLYQALKNELELSKYELEERLNQLAERHEMKEASFSHDYIDIDKNAVLLMNIKKELEDVKLALKKFDNNTYGICEKTGEMIPLDHLLVMPQARYKDEAAMFV